MGQERLGPFYFFISLVLGPLNSLLRYVPSKGERCLYWINLKESPLANVTAGGLAMLLWHSSFACVRS